MLECEKNEKMIEFLKKSISIKYFLVLENTKTAKAAYERGDYEEAKLQIDSIKILYPKAFEARKAGQALMLDVETKAL